jgi:hypothetical protein
MIARIIAVACLFVSISSHASPPTNTISRWNPQSAATAAQRDIAAGRIRFAYIGGIASYAPGLPQDSHTWLFVLHRYPQLQVGPQGCDQDQYFAERKAYATRYNHVMWSYVSKHR